MQDVCKVGDVIKVKVTKVDDKGKVNVSRKSFTSKTSLKKKKKMKKMKNKIILASSSPRRKELFNKCQ